MVSAAYLMGSTGIRFKDSHGIELKWLPVIPKIQGRMKPSDIRIRAEAVFKQVPVRITNLVIVNSNLSSFEMIQAAVAVADKYADNVMVIPPLLARLSFALEQLANPIVPEIPKDETILVVTIVKEFSDFIVLRRDKNFELYIVSHEIYKRVEYDEKFAQFYDYYYPHSTVILVHEDYHDLARHIRNKHHPERSFLKVFKRWDFMLFFGGLFRSIINEKEYDQRYHIPNFTNGFETAIHNKNGPNKPHILLEKRSRVPCDMDGLDGIPQNIKIFYSAEFNQVFEDLIWESKCATEGIVKASGSSTIGYVDERGVPHATPRAKPLIIKNVKKELPKLETKEEPRKTECNPDMELAIDFLTGNICEYNPTTKTKSFEEAAFDPSESSNSIKELTAILRKKQINALHVISDKESPKEFNDLIHKLCNNTSYIPYIKAQLSYCFKKIKNEENIEKFAIVLTAKNCLINVCLFEYRNGQYFVGQCAYDLTVGEAKRVVKAEDVKDIFIFRPKGVQLAFDIPNNDVTVNVFEVRDYDNMALNGVFDMDKNLKDLADTKDLKILFSSTQVRECSSPVTSDTCTFSNTSSPLNKHQNKESSCSSPVVEVIFHKGCFAIDIYQNGAVNRIKNSNGNYWTPLYLSMVEGKPEIGEKAKNDYQKFPKHVIYDVLKIIGKPLNEINIDQNWGFKLIENDKIVFFQVETPSGPRLIPQELVMSAFLKAIKLRAQSFMGNTEIKEIRLSTSFKLTESQEAIFTKAVLKNEIETVSFNVTDI